MSVHLTFEGQADRCLQRPKFGSRPSLDAPRQVHGLTPRSRAASPTPPSSPPKTLSISHLTKLRPTPKSLEMRVFLKFFPGPTHEIDLLTLVKRGPALRSYATGL